MSGGEPGMQNMKKILVVDDESEIRASIKEVLKEQFQIVTARDGEEALEAVRQEKPDLILTDVLMPKVSGYNFYKNLKNEKSDMSDIPMIVMSGRPSMTEFFDNWSIVSFLNKPFKAEDLIDSIHKAFKQKGLAQTKKIGKRSAAPIAPGASAAPARKQRLALISSADESVMAALNKYFQFKNFALESSVSEEEFVEMAAELRPDLIVCQYFRDTEIFDAEQVCRELSEKIDASKTLLIPICTPDLAREAEGKFEEGRLVVFESMRELREKIENFLY